MAWGARQGPFALQQPQPPPGTAQDLLDQQTVMMIFYCSFRNKI
jgi:hypothetical protein